VTPAFSYREQRVDESEEEFVRRLARELAAASSGVVYGRVGDADEILHPAVSALAVEDGPDDGVARFVGKAELGRPGPFGYTLRVVPRHPLLAGAAEMGLVTLPEAPAGLTTGDLR